MGRKKKKRKLPNGTGSITKLSGNRYKPFLARKKAIQLPDGKFYREVVGTFETWEEAYQGLINSDKKVTTKTTLYTLFERYMQTNQFKKLSKSSQNRHLNNIKKWEPIIYKPIEDVTFFELQEKMDYLEENGYQDHQTGEEKFYSRDGLKKIRASLSIAFKMAVKSSILTVNLADMITIETKEGKTGTTHFSIEFIEFCFTKIDEIPDVRKLLINIYTGLRPIEMRNLKKEHVDFEKNIIHGMGAKTDAGIERKIVIHPRIRPILMELYLKTDKYIMGKKMSKSYFTKYFFYKVLNDLNYKGDKTPYACRKTFAYLMNHYNVDKEVIKGMMGHTSYTTSSDHYIPNDTDKALIEFKKIL